MNPRHVAVAAAVVLTSLAITSDAQGSVPESSYTDRWFHDPKVTDTYEYFPDPGDLARFSAADGEAARMAGLNIPAGSLKAMSTPALVETVLNYPVWVHLFVFNSPQQGYDHIEGQFNGLSELYDRDDGAQELLRVYTTASPERVATDPSPFAFDALSMILSQPEILDRLGPEEQLTAIDTATSILAGLDPHRAAISEFYPELLLARAAVRCFPEAARFAESSPALAGYLATGVPEAVDDLASDLATFDRILRARGYSRPTR